MLVLTEIIRRRRKRNTNRFDDDFLEKDASEMEKDMPQAIEKISSSTRRDYHRDHCE